MMARWRICYAYLIGNLVGASLLGPLLLVPLMRIGALFGALFLLMIWVLHENVLMAHELKQLRERAKEKVTHGFAEPLAVVDKVIKTSEAGRQGKEEIKK